MFMKLAPFLLDFGPLPSRQESHQFKQERLRKLTSERDPVRIIRVRVPVPSEC